MDMVILDYLEITRNWEFLCSTLYLVAVTFNLVQIKVFFSKKIHVLQPFIFI